MNYEIVERQHKKFALVPLEQLESAEDLMDVLAYERALEAEGDSENIPMEHVDALCDAGTLGERIRIWRTYRGITQKQLAEKVGVTSQHITQIETGKRDGTISTLKSIVDALGIDLDDVV